MNDHTSHRGRGWHRSLVVGVCVLLGVVALSGVGCFGGDDSEGAGQAPVTTARTPGSTTTTTIEVVVDENAAYSTFRSKDPFISQAQSGEGVPGTTQPTSGPPTTRPSQPSVTTPTTIVRPTTTTRFQTTTTRPTGGGGSTTTAPPTSTTSTTAAHVHTLKVLGVAQVNGAATVTLQVDSSVYKDRRIGSVVSTSWGQIKVLDVNVGSKVVTLLHGSETLNLIVGQAVYE